MYPETLNWGSSWVDYCLLAVFGFYTYFPTSTTILTIQTRMYCKNHRLRIHHQSSQCIRTISKGYWSATHGSRSTTSLGTKISLKVSGKERYAEASIFYFRSSWCRSLPLDWNSVTHRRGFRPTSPVLDFANNLTRTIARER